MRRSLERAWQWSSGSVDRILAGEAPTVLDVATTTIRPDFYLHLDQTPSVTRALVVGANEVSATDWRADMHRRVRGAQKALDEIGPRLDPEQRDRLGRVIAVLNDLVV